MIAVKDGNEVALSDAHRVVNVAGLGVLVFFALDIAGADFTGKVFKFLTAAVVQDINIEFSLGQSTVSAAYTVGFTTSSGSL